MMVSIMSFIHDSMVTNSSQYIASYKCSDVNYIGVIYELIHTIHRLMDMLLGHDFLSHMF